MRQEYQVIVVGSGPAGSVAAYELAKKGIEVAILEKQHLPRYKCCAGGVSVGAAKLLDIDFQELVEDTITRVYISFQGKTPFHGEHSSPLMYTVMRDRFDYALVQRAKEAGAVVFEESEATQIKINDKGIEVSTSGGDFSAQYLVGADGANSLVARELKLQTRREWIVAIQREIEVEEEILAKVKSRVILDFGRVNRGYAWIFPKLQHLSVGMACLSSGAKNLKKYYHDFLISWNLDKGTTLREDTALLPISRGNPIVCENRVALVGDAAGLVDPLIGEGIYNAIWSAQLAAQTITLAIAEGSSDLLSYQQAVNQHIVPELEIAKKFSRLFTTFPALFFEMLKREEIVWRGCRFFLRRDMNYSSIMQGLGGPRGLMKLLLKTQDGGKIRDKD